MNKALFLDRDGVLNFGKKGSGYTYVIDDFKLLKHSIPTLRKYQKMGFLLIIITNQGGISKKIYTKKDVELVHSEMKKQLLEYGVTLKDIYFCPHHDKHSKCLCRKPNSLMLEKALARYNIDPLQSLMIGDSQTDMLAAKQLGIKGILIKENDNLSNYI